MLKNSFYSFFVFGSICLITSVILRSIDNSNLGFSMALAAGLGSSYLLGAFEGYWDGVKAVKENIKEAVNDYIKELK